MNLKDKTLIVVMIVFNDYLQTPRQCFQQKCVALMSERSWQPRKSTRRVAKSKELVN